MIEVKLNQLLAKNKMTRKALSEKIGVRPNTIGDLCRENSKTIDLNTLSKICHIFDCSVGEVLEFKKEHKCNIKGSIKDE